MGYPVTVSKDDLCGMIGQLLKHYEAQHQRGCPERMQDYWKIRPEYRPHGHVDQPCTCGLDSWLKGKEPSHETHV